MHNSGQSVRRQCCATLSTAASRTSPQPWSNKSPVSPLATQPENLRPTLWSCLMKRNPTVFVLLCPAFFHLAYGLRVHSCCAVCQHFIPFKAGSWPIAFIPYLDDWLDIWAGFLLWVYDAAVNVNTQIPSPCLFFLWVYALEWNCWIQLVIL